MARFRLLVLSNPEAGREAEFNDWYTNQHVPDLLRIPGVVGAQRLHKLAGTMADQYLAIYELETDDPQAVVDDMRQRMMSGALPMSDALRQPLGSGIFEVIHDSRI